MVSLLNSSETICYVQTIAEKMVRSGGTSDEVAAALLHYHKVSFSDDAYGSKRLYSAFLCYAHAFYLETFCIKIRLLKMISTGQAF